MQSSQGGPVQQFCSQTFPSKHQLSSELKLHPNTSWAQNWSSIQTPAELRTEAPSKHQLSSELKLHPNTGWVQNWSSIQTQVGFRTEAPSKHRLGSELKLSHWMSAHKGHSSTLCLATHNSAFLLSLQPVPDFIIWSAGFWWVCPVFQFVGLFISKKQRFFSTK